MGQIMVQEDTAGNKYYAEFDGSSTASVRNWKADKDGKILYDRSAGMLCIKCGHWHRDYLCPSCGEHNAAGNN